MINKQTTKKHNNKPPDNQQRQTNGKTVENQTNKQKTTKIPAKWTTDLWSLMPNLRNDGPQKKPNKNPQKNQTKTRALIFYKCGNTFSRSFLPLLFVLRLMVIYGPCVLLLPLFWPLYFQTKTTSVITTKTTEKTKTRFGCTPQTNKQKCCTIIGIPMNANFATAQRPLRHRPI